MVDGCDPASVYEKAERVNTRKSMEILYHRLHVAWPRNDGRSGAPRRRHAVQAAKRKIRSVPGLRGGSLLSGAICRRPSCLSLSALDITAAPCFRAVNALEQEDS